MHHDRTSSRLARFWRVLLWMCIASVILCVMHAIVQRPELLVRREVLKLAEQAGLMDTSKGLGGQILGYNYYRSPRIMHWIAQSIASACIAAPVFLAAVVLAASLVPSPLRGARRSPFLFGAIVFIVVAPALTRTLTFPLQDVTLRIASAMGTPPARMNGMLMLPSGPFPDASRTDHVIWNGLHRFAPGCITRCLACFAACAGIKLLHDWQRRKARHACALCSYPCEHLARCPECGHERASSATFHT